MVAGPRRVVWAESAEKALDEIQDTMLRELFVYDYRMIYRVHPEYIVIEAFVHGARDFSKWHREEIPDL